MLGTLVPPSFTSLRRIAVLSCFVFGVLAAGGASAQACGDLDPVPEGVYAGYVELLGDLFPLSAAACERLSRTTVASCHRTVSSTASCIGALIRGVAKAGRTACAAQGAGQEECLDQLEQVLGGAQANAAQEARGAHQECNSWVASQLFSLCFGPG